MSEDFYTQTAQRRFAQIEADRAQALADLHQARATGDDYQSTDAVQRLADLDAAARNLADLHQRYAQSQNPPPPPEISRDERMAKPLDRMDWSDALELAKTSKYGQDLKPDDPNIIAGMREVRAPQSEGGIIMFDDNSKDLTATLAEMHRVARIKSNFSETDAKEKMRKWIKQDSRFDEFDAAKLADRVNECIQSGGNARP